MICDKDGYVMPDLVARAHRRAIHKPNIFDRLVSEWDRKTLKNTMADIKESKPRIIPLSFQFIDQVKHYDCQVFKSRHYFFIGGCRVSHKLIPLHPGTKRAVWQQSDTYQHSDE